MSWKYDNPEPASSQAISLQYQSKPLTTTGTFSLSATRVTMYSQSFLTVHQLSLTL